MGVRVNDAAVLPEIARRLPPGSASARTSIVDELFSVLCPPESGRPELRRFHLLYRGGERLARTLDRRELLDDVEGYVKLSVAEKATRWAFLHAGVVGWRGGAIVIPGRSHSGKSRLVEALVRRGATYYSDEYAVLDVLGRVHAYPAPLSLREEDGGATRRVRLPAPGGARKRPPLPVVRVVLTRYREGALWRPRRPTPGRALLGLLDHAIPARHRPAEVIAVLKRVVSTAAVDRGERGEADVVAARLLDADAPA